jgi:hypothetical protein
MVPNGHAAAETNIGGRAALAGERSRGFYTEVLGGRVVFPGEPVNVALSNSWIIPQPPQLRPRWHHPPPGVTGLPARRNRITRDTRLRQLPPDATPEAVFARAAWFGSGSPAGG